MRQSGAETLVTEEPYELIAHVRVCGGAGWVTTGSTRKPLPLLVQRELFAQEQVFGRQSCRRAQTQPQDMERIHKKHAQWRGRL